MKKTILIMVCIGIALTSLVIAGISMSIDKIIIVDNKLNISKLSDKYSYNTKYFIDGNNITFIFRNATFYTKKCIMQNESLNCSYIPSTRKKLIGTTKKENDIKTIIQKDIEKETTIKPNTTGLVKEDIGKIVLSVNK